MSISSQKIPYPARLDLARTPTPLEPLSRLSEKFGVEMHVKRDDLTSADLTGNKVRKLEFLLADALAKGSDTSSGNTMAIGPFVNTPKPIATQAIAAQPSPPSRPLSRRSSIAR